MRFLPRKGAARVRCEYEIRKDEEDEEVLTAYGKEYWKGMKKADEEGMMEERRVGGVIIYSVSGGERSGPLEEIVVYKVVRGKSLKMGARQWKRVVQEVGGHTGNRVDSDAG